MCSDVTRISEQNNFANEEQVITPRNIRAYTDLQRAFIIHEMQAQKVRTNRRDPMAAGETTLNKPAVLGLRTVTWDDSGDEVEVKATMPSAPNCTPAQINRPLEAAPAQFMPPLVFSRAYDSKLAMALEREDLMESSMTPRTLERTTRYVAPVAAPKPSRFRPQD